MRGITVQLACISCFVGLVFSSPGMAQNAPKYCLETADNVVIYVDKTTPYDEIDKSQLVEGVSHLFESMKGGERFSIRTIAESFPASASLIDQCIPVCSGEGFFGDLFSSCTEGAVINDKKHLRNAIIQQLRTLLGNFTELPTSEIVRTVSLSSSVEFRPNRQNKIFLFTDLIENSQYLPGKQFLTSKNDLLISKISKDGLIPNLQGADVHVFGVGRSGVSGNRRALDQKLLSKIEDFWTKYFKAANATVIIQQSLGQVN